MAACAAGSWIPPVAFVSIPLGLILWGVFWNKLARLSQKLPLNGSPAFLAPLPTAKP